REVSHLDPLPQRARWEGRSIARSPLVRLEEGDEAIGQAPVLDEAPDPERDELELALQHEEAAQEQHEVARAQMASGAPLHQVKERPDGPRRPEGERRERAPEDAA